MKLLIVEDCEVVRAELRRLFELTGAVSLVGEARNGLEALRQAQALQPDIVLMDLEMPGMDGFEATRRLKQQHLARVVIVFTVYSSALNQQIAREAGADAFVVKGGDLDALLALFDQFSHQER